MIDVKLQLIMTVVYVLLYAAEIWTVNRGWEKNESHLRQGRCRRILAVKWQSQRNNEEIRAVFILFLLMQLYNEKKQWWIQSE